MSSPNPAAGSSDPSGRTGPSSPGSGGPSGPWVSAWQTALAAEHEAIFGYDTLGPLLISSVRATAVADERAHRGRRDAATTAMTAAAIEPVAARADYPLPDPLHSAADAEAYALTLEVRCAAAWRYVVATTAQPASGAPAPLRAAAVTALRDSAVRATGWRARLTPETPTVPFPGLP